MAGLYPKQQSRGEQIGDGARGQPETRGVTPTVVECPKHFFAEGFSKIGGEQVEQRGDCFPHQASPSGSRRRERISSTTPARRSASVLRIFRPSRVIR